jgi:hypothetical protein
MPMDADVCTLPCTGGLCATPPSSVLAKVALTIPLHVMKSDNNSELRHNASTHHMYGVYGCCSGVGVGVSDLSGWAGCLELGDFCLREGTHSESCSPNLVIIHAINVYNDIIQL